MSEYIDAASIHNLMDKYGGLVPRYTSYPTAPEWKDVFDQSLFERAIQESNYSKKNYSLYLHLPFCQSQCYFCGCNVVISPKHGIEIPYLENFKQELSYYGKQIDFSRQVAQMAWGGGTPTYLSPEQIIDLHSHIKANFNLMSKPASQQDYEYAVEIDPRFTSKEHLEALAYCGFNRLSMGIQDFNPATQSAINRIQSIESVEAMTSLARKLGFNSINFDLIYGLPHQNLDSFEKTISEVLRLKPDRIALFNYAHLPEIFAHQNKYIDSASLPEAKEKLEIFVLAINKFVENGFLFIGLDHFARQDDSLSQSFKNRTLSRNFQGYTTHAGLDLFGFGLSAISDVQGIYKQNSKKINQYSQDWTWADKFMILKQEDLERRSIIKELMCNNFVIIDKNKYLSELSLLEEFLEQKLIKIDSQADKANIEVNLLGKFFIRNIASVFDQYLQKEDGHKLFSRVL